MKAKLTTMVVMAATAVSVVTAAPHPGAKGGHQQPPQKVVKPSQPVRHPTPVHSQQTQKPQKHPQPQAHAQPQKHPQPQAHAQPQKHPQPQVHQPKAPQHHAVKPAPVKPVRPGGRAAMRGPRYANGNHIPPPNFVGWRRGVHPHKMYRSVWIDDIWYDAYGYPCYSPYYQEVVVVPTDTVIIQTATGTTVVTPAQQTVVVPAQQTVVVPAQQTVVTPVRQTVVVPPPPPPRRRSLLGDLVDTIFGR